MVRRLTTELAYTPGAFVALAGVWLALTPLVVDDRAAYPWWNDVAAGSVITVLAAVRVVIPGNTGVLSVIAAALGGWLVAAPFLLGYSDLPGVAWNDVLVGALVAIVAAVSAFAGEGGADGS